MLTTETVRIEEFLSRIKPFKNISQANRKALAAEARRKNYTKGQLIFQEGEPADSVWIVQTGRVHLMKVLSEGKASTTCVMTPGESFCCLPALDRKPYPADAQAAEECAVLRIPLNALHKVMDRQPQFIREAVCLFCERLRQVERSGCGVFESAEKRLAQTLLTLSKKFGLTIPLTRQELSEIAGTTSETTIRTLSRFKQQGLVTSSRGETTLLKPDQLSLLISGL